MDKIWYRNPSKSEVIGRCGGDEKNEWPRRTEKRSTLKTKTKQKSFFLNNHVNTSYQTQTYCCTKKNQNTVQFSVNIIMYVFSSKTLKHFLNHKFSDCDKPLNIKSKQIWHSPPEYRNFILDWKTEKC